MKNISLISKASIVAVLCCCITVFLTACNPSDHGYSATKTSVKTPKGTTVYGGNVSTITTADYNDANSYATSYYPNATKLREPTNDYNCHSYAWNSQSTSNKIWIGLTINNEDLRNEHKKYWTDGSYVYITNGSGNSIPSSVANGSKVRYINDDHSAIKTSSTKFTSKWGMGGLFEHTPEYSPYTATSLYYYKYSKK
ncbi:MAG: hypothetical protein PHV32_04310 [Eubacteriales bacterium]|nr:hypothetical protein [Oscillospiraceae bacterium]MDD4493560.1 hypothetical protein [Eubacteriales bacterium]